MPIENTPELYKDLSNLGKIAETAYQRSGNIKPSDLTLAFQVRAAELVESGDLPESLSAPIDTYDTGEHRTTSELIRLTFMATEQVFDEERINPEQGDWAKRVLSPDEAKDYINEMTDKFSETLTNLINQTEENNG